MNTYLYRISSLSNFCRHQMLSARETRNEDSGDTPQVTYDIDDYIYGDLQQTASDR